MLRIAICDDAAAYGDRLAQTVKKWAIERQLNIQLKNFISGEELLADIEFTGYFDIILMDIDLKGGMNGIETAGRIKKIYEHFCLIFISQYDNYYKEAFRVYPFQYLEKTTTKSRLIEILNQAVDRYRYLQEIFVFRFKGITYSIRLHEVLYFASDKRVIRICMENGTEYVFYEKLDEIEKKLKKYNNHFIRIHKSYLVNGRQVEMYHPKYVKMRNKQILPVSMDKRSSLMHFHMEMMEIFE